MRDWPVLPAFLAILAIVGFWFARAWAQQQVAGAIVDQAVHQPAPAGFEASPQPLGQPPPAWQVTGAAGTGTGR
jgi:hypothetical protein